MSRITACRAARHYYYQVRNLKAPGEERLGRRFNQHRSNCPICSRPYEPDIAKNPYYDPMDRLGECERAQSFIFRGIEKIHPEKLRAWRRWDKASEEMMVREYPEGMK